VQNFDGVLYFSRSILVGHNEIMPGVVDHTVWAQGRFVITAEVFDFFGGVNLTEDI
jgi:hypothetical protein